MPKNGKSKAVALTTDPIPDTEVPAYPDGWELIELPKRFPRNYNTKRLGKDLDRRNSIVDALAAGAPIKWICRAYHCHPYTVAAIARSEPLAVERGREYMSKLCMKIAGIAANSYLDDLAEGRVSPNSKPIHSAIFADKSLALAGQATSIVEHRRSEAISPAKVNGFWTIDAEIVGTSDPQSPAPGSEPRQIGPAPTQDTALDTTPAPTVVPVEPAAPEAPPATTAPDRPPRGGEGGGPPPPAPDGL